MRRRKLEKLRTASGEEQEGTAACAEPATLHSNEPLSSEHPLVGVQEIDQWNSSTGLGRVVVIYAQVAVRPPHVSSVDQDGVIEAVDIKPAASSAVAYEA